MTERAASETFRVGDFEHTIGDVDCAECWSDYPRKCTCGHLIHAEFGDENWDGDYWLRIQCEHCGDDYEEDV